MATIQKFVYEWPPGVKPVELFEWLETLTPKEKQQWEEARARQEKIRQQAIGQGRLKLGNRQYVWKNEQEASVNKQNDPEWEKFWNRYLQETQTQFRVVFVDDEDDKT